MAEGNAPVFITNEQMRISSLIYKIVYRYENGYCILDFYLDDALSNGFRFAFKNTEANGQIITQTITNGSLANTHYLAI